MESIVQFTKEANGEHNKLDIRNLEIEGGAFHYAPEELLRSMGIWFVDKDLFSDADGQ